jgi:hypothetical protein
VGQKTINASNLKPYEINQSANSFSIYAKDDDLLYEQYDVIGKLQAKGVLLKNTVTQIETQSSEAKIIRIVSQKTKASFTEKIITVPNN